MIRGTLPRPYGTVGYGCVGCSVACRVLFRAYRAYIADIMRISCMYRIPEYPTLNFARRRHGAPCPTSPRPRIQAMSRAFRHADRLALFQPFSDMICTLTLVGVYWSYQPHQGGSGLPVIQTADGPFQHPRKPRAQRELQIDNLRVEARLSR